MFSLSSLAQELPAVGGGSSTAAARTAAGSPPPAAEWFEDEEFQRTIGRCVSGSMKDAGVVSKLLWNAHHNLPADVCDIFDILQTVELARSLLVQVESNAAVRELGSGAVLQWALATSDLMEELRELLCDWQKRGEFMKCIRNDSPSRKSLDWHFSRLSLHTKALDEAIKQQTTTPPPPIHEEGATAALIDAKRLFPASCEEGLAFWVDAFGPATYSVRFDAFKAALNDRLPRLQDRTWQQLRSSLDANQTGSVTVVKWGAFLEGFGPGLVAAVMQLGDTLAEDFFAGFLSYEETVAVLRMCARGAYLIRFSTTQPCGLVLAYKSPTDEIKQYMISARRGGFDMDNVGYDSLREVIKSKPKEFLFPAPTVRSVARARFFKGFLTKEETVRLLQDQPSGTFLFRFSNGEPGALVVGCKVGSEVQQSRIYPEPQNGGYLLGKRIYKSIEDIVRENVSRLRIPLVVPGESELDIPVSNTTVRATVLDRYGGLRETERSPPSKVGTPSPQMTWNQQHQQQGEGGPTSSSPFSSASSSSPPLNPKNSTTAASENKDNQYGFIDSLM